MTDLGTPEFWQRVQNDPERLAAEVCFIDVVNLDMTLQHHAAKRGWINAAFEVAKIEEERVKWDVTRARAVALLKAEGTVDERKALAELDTNVVSATKTLFDIQRKRGALRAMSDALEDRKDMLIQIAAKQRQEKKDY